jgi:uncharacterized protein (DUF362 family)
MPKPKVILRRAPTYDPAAIDRIIREGLAELGLEARVRGRITIKPNVVMAHPKVTPSAYTRPEFLEGLIRALRAQPAAGRITVAEKCGAAIPTSRMFRRAKYYKLKRKYGFRLVPIEEGRKRTVVLSKGVVHKSIRTGRDIVDNDFLVYAPKLKTNSLAQGLTAAVKLNIGILCDRQRMWNHNYNLDDKIADLLEVGYPAFIATDAIEISMGGNHLTQHGRHLGLIVMSDHPLAHDAVCARIFHLDPRAIRHLAIAERRGYGSLSLEDVELSGDITLDEVRRATEGWETGYIKVDDVKTPIKVICGEPYCGGGCHGVFLDWLYMIKDRKPKLWPKLPPWTVVIGKYKGDVTADKLLLLGTCTEIEGKVVARKIRRIRGCPPKHKSLVLMIFLKLGILNPLFRADLIWDAYICLFFTWVRRLVKGRF